MLRVALIVIVVAITIYCIVEVAQARPAEVRRAPRWLWAAACILLPGVGALAWLTLGRPNAESRHAAIAEEFPIAPDDDPDYLRKLHP
ncbi:PLD nuclease N-terminal domain-containing protein [Granulicoccus phenolivorans]|uniref:PLD nuclease N-terminal domain-containing protein n=1 Tax=Granulicoccus phenolivorans TaxID=266854 RepID=UPI00040C7CD3|nr:PLD nuclease N-terminal domain-containing protein [Granulicoccus phenolivorans]